MGKYLTLVLLALGVIGTKVTGYWQHLRLGVIGTSSVCLPLQD